MKPEQFLQMLGEPLLLMSLLVAYIVAEFFIDVAKKTPLWLIRQILVPLRLYWCERAYLLSLTKDEKIRGAATGYVRLQSIRIQSRRSSDVQRPLIDRLSKIVRDEKQAVVVGNPGAGKTTALRVLTYRYARRALVADSCFWGIVVVICSASLVAGFLVSPQWIWISPVCLLTTALLGRYVRRWKLPLLIYMRLYPVYEEEFFSAAAYSSSTTQFLGQHVRRYLEDSRLVLLLDGINEVVDQYQEVLGIWEKRLKTPGSFYCRNAILFTSRRGGTPHVQLGLDTCLAICPLDDDGVRLLLLKRGLSHEDIKRVIWALHEQGMLKQNALGRNPLWLSFIVDAGFPLELGSNRARLFETVIRRLTDREINRRPVSVPLDVELDALAELALMMQEHGIGLAAQDGGLQVARQFIRDWLDSQGLGESHSPEAILAEGAGAKLLNYSRRLNRVFFEHELLQEFFAAYGLRNSPESAVDHICDRWWQTHLFLAGLVQDHDSYIRRMAGHGSARRVILVTLLLTGVDTASEETVQFVMGTLRRSLRETPTLEAYRNPIETLAQIPDARSAVTEQVLPLLSDSDPEVGKKTVGLLAKIGTRSGLDAIVGSFERTEIAAEAKQVLANLGSMATPSLVDSVDDSNKAVREAVEETIVRIGKSAADDIAQVIVSGERETQRRHAALVAASFDESFVVEALITALNQDPNAGVRWAAARTLGRLVAHQAESSVVAALEDKDASVRWAAAEALGDLQSEVAVEPLAELLRDEDRFVREKAALALGKIRSGQAIGSLSQALDDADSVVRASACWALGQIADERAEEPLIRALRDQSREARLAATKALRGFATADAVESLVKVLSDSDEGVVQAAVTVLVGIGRTAEEPLCRVIVDGREDWRTREAAIRALGSIGGISAANTLVQVLHAEDAERPELRAGAAKALGKLGDFSTHHDLIAVLGDPDERIRASAAHALGKLQVSAAAPTLQHMALNDENGLVRRTACIAIALIGRTAIEPLVQQTFAPRRYGHYEEYYDSRRRILEAVLAMGETGIGIALDCLVEKLKQESILVYLYEWASPLGRLGLDYLLQLVENSDPEVRQAAATALGNIDDPHSVEPLINALDDNDWHVREAAAAALGNIGDPRSVEPLINALANDSPSVREAATVALGNIGDPRSVEPLITALDEDYWPVREAAAVALGNIGDPCSVEPLITALDDSDSDLHEAAAVALGNIGASRAIRPLILVTLLGGFGYHGREKVLEALHRIIRARGIDPLVELLSDGNQDVRRKAAQLLGDTNDTRAATALVDALEAEAEDADVRSAIVASLKELGGHNAVVRLLETLKASNPEARSAAAEVLGEIGSQHPGANVIERLTQSLIAALSDPAASVRWSSARALRRLDWTPVKNIPGVIYCIENGLIEECAAMGEVAVKPLLRILQDDEESEERRENSATTLGIIGHPEGIAPLSAIAGSSEQPGNLRRVCVLALGRIGGTGATTALVDALRESDLQDSSSQALASVGQAAVEPLTNLLLEGDDETNQVVCKTLDDIGWTPQHDRCSVIYWITKRNPSRCVEIGEAAVPYLLESLGKQESVKAWKAREFRLELIRVLGEIGSSAAVPALKEQSNDQQDSVRLAAVKALGMIDSHEVIIPLLERLSDREQSVHDAAATALCKPHWAEGQEVAAVAYWIVEGQPKSCAAVGPSAIEPLTIALTAQSEDIQVTAVNALGILRASECGQALTKILCTSDSQRVRKAACQALLSIGYCPVGELLETIREALRHNWRGRARYSAEALQSFPDKSAVGDLVAILKKPSRERRGDEWWNAREAAATALVEIGAPAVSALVLAVRHWNINTRLFSTWALGEIGDPGSLPELKWVENNDENGDVRRHAHTAVAQIETKLGTGRDKDD